MAYVRYQRTQNAQIVASEFMQQFVKEIPKLPGQMTQLSQKLMSDSTSIHEIVESIKRDPALAGNVLKCVNSAKYSFIKQKHPAISGFAPLLDTARIGADLVHHWGLPDRLCRII